MRLIFAAALALSLLAQPPATPPDRKAFSAATAEKDPATRAAALEKFLHEFPSSRSATMARRSLVSAWVQATPEQALNRVAILVKSLPPSDAAPLYRFLSSELVAAGKAPTHAETAARRALRLFHPESSQSRASYLTQRAQYQEALAKALEARGQQAKALKVYREALAANPASSASALALAAAEEKAGRADAALGYYAQSFLARPSTESRQRFAEAWKRSNRASGDAASYLDQRYRQLFHNPIHATPYQKTAARSNRVVLAEVYTGAGCPPCVGADLAFDAVLERYPRTDVAVVMYHEHVPRPDPLTNSDTLSRWKWQQGRGVPTFAIDGVAHIGGGGRDAAPELESNIRAEIDKDLEKPAGAGLSLKAANDGRSVRAIARVTGITEPNPNLVLNLALVEKEVRYSGENGIRFHPMVVRRIHTVSLQDTTELDEAHAFSISEVDQALKQALDDFEKHDERHNKDGKFRFAERKDTIDPASLAVVAFVQDTETKEILQAAWADAPKE